MKEPVNAKGQTLDEFLAAYDDSIYRHPSVTVDMAVFTLLEGANGVKPALMLIRRKNHPNIGMWALPGGFVEMDEELEEAAARELMEETGVTGVPLCQCGAFGGVHRDPRTRVITVAYYTALPIGTLHPQAGDDAADARLFTVDVQNQSVQGHETKYDLVLNGKEQLVSRCSMLKSGLGEAFISAGRQETAGDHALVISRALLELCRHSEYSAAALCGERHELYAEVSAQLKGFFR